jgi:hypothetical protein
MSFRLAFRTAFPTKFGQPIRRFGTTSKTTVSRGAFWTGVGTASLIASSPLYADSANAWWGWSKPDTAADKIENLGNQLKREVDRAIENVSAKAGDLLDTVEETKRREQKRVGKLFETDDGSPQDLTQLLTVSLLILL